MKTFDANLFKEQLFSLNTEANRLFELLNSIDPIDGFEYMVFTGVTSSCCVVFQGSQPWCDGASYRYTISIGHILEPQSIIAEFEKRAIEKVQKEERLVAASKARLEARERQELLRLQEKYGK